MKVKMMDLKVVEMLYREVMDKLENYDYYLIYNVKRSESDQNDFFSVSEFEEVKDIVKRCKVNIIMLEESKEAIEHILKLDASRSVIVNLSRTGNYNNKKSVIKSLCDWLGITCISSSVYTVNLCRNKSHFSLISAECNVNTIIPTFVLREENREKILNNLLGKEVIVKYIQSSGSDGVSLNSVFRLDDNFGGFDFDGRSVIQEFIKGKEIEVPFFVTGDVIYLLGAYELIKRNNEKVLTMEASNLFDYNFKCNNSLISQEIVRTIECGVRKFGIEYYGRLDFIVSSDGVKAKLFDVATSPFFINNTSMKEGIERISMDHTVIDVLCYIAILS